MTTYSRAVSLLLIFFCAGYTSGSPQDPVKKAEIERKRAEMKAEFERKRAEFERKRAAQKDVRPPTATTARSTPPPKAKTAPNIYDEKSLEFQCPDGKFKVYMPVNPRKQDLQAMGITMRMYGFQDRDGAFAVAYTDLPIPANETPEQIQKRLDGARDGMVQNVKGKLTGESRIYLQSKHPGREVRADLPDVNGFLKARIYLVGSRMYQVAVMGLRPKVDSAEASKFLGSLVLTP